MPRILLLGAGFVARPALEYLLRDRNNHVIVACRTIGSAEKLCEGLCNTSAISLNVTNQDQLEDQIKEVDLVISLIPYVYHLNVVKGAIKYKKDVCTTSYVSESLREVESEIKAAGITVMTEIGLDPGIDHLYAISMIEKVHEEGGKIIEFISFCGGLPAPECANNPLGYKFSWSSRGVLLALQNSAKYYENGKLISVDGKDLMKSIREYNDIQGFEFVCYPNRDSSVFKEYYNIPEAQTVIRGTLRYKQFPKFIQGLVDLGFLNADYNPLFVEPKAWPIILKEFLKAKSSSKIDLSSKLSSELIKGFEWLDLFNEYKLIIPRNTALDTLCAELESKMQYEEGERDMVALQHKFKIENSNGKIEYRTSTLVAYGDTKFKAMERLVGIPCGIASQQILNKKIRKGLIQPYDMKINQSLIDDLKKEGIFLEEKTL